MKAAISILENALEVVETNEPINRAAGNIEQADLEIENAQEFRQALGVLLSVQSGRQGSSNPVDHDSGLKFETRGTTTGRYSATQLRVEETPTHCLVKLMSAVDRMTLAAKGTDEGEMKLALNCINEAMSFARRII